MNAVWEDRPNPRLVRVEMWCARFWVESRDAGLVALAAGDGKAYRRCRRDEQEWFAALLVVNRLSLEIEPMHGKGFVNEDQNDLRAS